MRRILVEGARRKAQVKRGWHLERVEVEEAELAIVTEYLPRQLSTDEVRTVVREAIEQGGATSARDMGAVMKAVMPRVRGVADGKLVNQTVREMLAAD